MPNGRGGGAQEFVAADEAGVSNARAESGQRPRASCETKTVTVGLLKNPVLTQLRGRARRRSLVTDEAAALTAVALGPVGCEDAGEAFFNSPTVPDSSIRGTRAQDAAR
jgi:hypothetical protein